MNYCFVLQSRFWIYTMLFGFYMDMYILTLLASRFLRSNIRMSFKNYSCTCSCCFWRSSLCTYTFWLKYIRHSYVAAFFFLHNKSATQLHTGLPWRLFAFALFSFDPSNGFYFGFMSRWSGWVTTCFLSILYFIHRATPARRAMDHRDMFK